MVSRGWEPNMANRIHAQDSQLKNQVLFTWGNEFKWLTCGAMFMLIVLGGTVSGFFIRQEVINAMNIRSGIAKE